MASDDLCLGCVYHPPNLPRAAYPEADWQALQDKTCSYDFEPGDTGCEAFRKTECAIVDLGGGE